MCYGLKLRWLGLGLLMGLAACEPRPEAEAPVALSASSLGELSYPLDYVESGLVDLHGGRFVSAPDPLAGTRITVQLSTWAVSGDLDGDGQPDSAVVLITDTGGTGVFYDLAVVRNREGQPGAVSVLHLGDRIQLKALKIQGGLLELELVMAGPQDPACCPSQRALQRFRLQGDRLVKVA